MLPPKQESAPARSARPEAPAAYSSIASTVDPRLQGSELTLTDTEARVVTGAPVESVTLNLSGIVCPALATFTVGAASTGARKPVKTYIGPVHPVAAAPDVVPGGQGVWAIDSLTGTKKPGWAAIHDVAPAPGW